MASIESQVRSSPSIALVGSMKPYLHLGGGEHHLPWPVGSSELFWNTSTAGY
jgi:hypothetical protein